MRATRRHSRTQLRATRVGGTECICRRERFGRRQRGRDLGGTVAHDRARDAQDARLPSSANAALGKAIDQLITDFTTAHPNVKITRTATDFATLLTKQQLIMSGPNPCDICDIAVNYTVAGKLAEAGLIANSGPLRRAVRLGGEVLAVPLWAVAIWSAARARPKLRPVHHGGHRRHLLQQDEAGGSRTWRSRPRSRNSRPIWRRPRRQARRRSSSATSTSTRPSTSSSRSTIAIARRTTCAITSTAWPRVSFDEPCNLQAATTFSDWIKAGYFGKGDPNGLGLDDARNAFIKGDGVFFVDGTWDTAAIDTGLGDKVGFFNMPPPADGSNGLVVLGGLGQTFTIHGKSAHPEVAAAFLDSLISDKAVATYLAAGAVPGFKYTTTGTFSSVRQDVLTAIDTANTSDALVGYLDGPTPRMYDVLSAALQDLISGKQTPKQFVATVQADYAKGP